MDGERFDKIVESRARERVEKNIAIFKKSCEKAAETLLHCTIYSGDGPAYSYRIRGLFQVLASATHREHWPVELWHDEEKLVEKELLETLNELQKAFLAADKNIEAENKPESFIPEIISFLFYL